MEFSMRTETREPVASEPDSFDLPPATVFDLLADDRRRYALHYLSRKVGAVQLDDLAEQIALWEGDPSRDRYERILTDLCHRHLPRLTDAGVVRFDADRETVESRPAADAVAPFLELAGADDLRSDR